MTVGKEPHNSSDEKAIMTADEMLAEIERLKEVLEKTIETARFYKVSSGDKGTLKFGYSRVIEEAKKGL